MQLDIYLRASRLMHDELHKNWEENTDFAKSIDMYEIRMIYIDIYLRPSLIIIAIICTLDSFMSRHAEK
jgi:hypothetical protein